tara:strand:+ start:826 stop:1935 length:1110 start_codon:yes stop_codon:yes gene_type:complete
MSTKEDSFTYKDKFFMSLALDLAKAKNGLTGINPAVGAVIVNKKNEIISIGSTGINGTPHAEDSAISNSIDKLKDSTLYVTLEPCVHYGKTPPCTKKIIKNKICKVFFSVPDIDKKVRNKCKNILIKNGIKVKEGLLKKKVSYFYNSYKFNRKYKIPFVTGKIAITKNNVIYSDQTKKITNKQTDKLTHYLRFKNDTILVTSKTINIDNPKLNCRIRGLKRFSPKRVILDKNLEIHLNSYIVKSINKNNTIIFYNKSSLKKSLFLKKKGALLIKTKLGLDKNLDLKKILKKLYKFNCRNLLVEGGSYLTKNFLKQRLFNNFYLFESNKKDPLKTNHKIFDSKNLLNKIFKKKTNIKNVSGKDKIIQYNL